MGSLFFAMKSLALFFVFAFFLSVKGQGELMHFTRTLNLPSLFLPGTAFDSQNFNIVIPDSVYSTAQIYIKKASLKKEGKFYVNFYIDSTKVHAETFLECKGTKNEKLLRSYFAERLTNQEIITRSGQFCIYREGYFLELIISKVGRKTSFKIYISECNPEEN